MLDIPGLEEELCQEFDWGFYRENFLSKEKADALFALASSWPRKRE